MRRRFPSPAGNPSPIQFGCLRSGNGAVSKEPRVALPIPDATADREGCGRRTDAAAPHPALYRFPWRLMRAGGIGVDGH